MSRKNTMLGLAALAAFGFAATSFAQCPSGPVPPWSSQLALGGSLEIAPGGFAGTSCRLDAAITTTGPGSAYVRDNTPESEPRYRAQFIVDVDQLAGLNTIQTVKIFSAASDNDYSGHTEVVRLSVNGNLTGSSKVLNIATVSEGAAGNLVSATANLSPGENTIEIDWDTDAGQLRVWVNAGDESSPTVTLAANNSGWSGVDYAILGLSSASQAYRNSQQGAVVSFDEFDSRRSTFIGL